MISQVNFHWSESLKNLDSAIDIHIRKNFDFIVTLMKIYVNVMPLNRAFKIVADTFNLRFSVLN
jgi:hypothetical protein